MPKPCFIYQPWGIGDILYIQKIVHHFHNAGHPITIPVRPDLLWLKDYLGTDGIDYVSLEADFPFKGQFITLARLAERLTPKNKHRGPLESRSILFLPLEPAHRFCLNRSMMESKYGAMQVDGADWAQWVRPRRDRAKEDRLFQRLRLDSAESYCLINGQSSTRKINIDISAPREVHLRAVEGFTLLDWSKVVEQARLIATIDTSLVLLTEVLHPAEARLIVISRHHPPSFRDLRPIVQLPWRFVPDVD